MAIDKETFKESGTSAKEMVESAPWIGNLRDQYPWLWTELDEFLKSPMEFVIIKALWLVNDPWADHYPNRSDGLRLLWEIAKELEAKEE